MKPTGWIVTRNYCDPRNCMYEEVEIIGPGDCEIPKEELLKGHPFKMYDDDHNLYYTGFLVGDKKSHEALTPLEDYGTPNAGASYIKYQNDETKKWESV